MKSLALVVAAASVVLLAGCTSGEPDPIETATVTAPAPAPTTSERTDDSPIDSYDAYYVCLADVYRFATGTRPPYEESELEFADYSSDVVTAEGDGFRVQLRGEGDAVDSVYCVVSGTIGDPQLGGGLYPR